MTVTNSISKSNPNSSVYVGSGCTNIPGLTNIIFAPLELKDGTKALKQALKIGDREGIGENGLRVIQAPISFSNASLQLSWYMLHAGRVLQILQGKRVDAILCSGSLLARAIVIAAFALCIIEMGVELLGFSRSEGFLNNYYPSKLESIRNALKEPDPQKRQLKFSDQITSLLSSPLPKEIEQQMASYFLKKENPDFDFQKTSREILDNVEVNFYLEHLKRLRRDYFEIPPKEMESIDCLAQKKIGSLSKEQKIEDYLVSKKHELVRRVHPWLADEIEKTTPEIIQNLQSEKVQLKMETKEKAEKLFKNIQIQSQKKLLIHGIGILAVAITLAGLIAGLMALPFLIPFALLTVGGILSFARYYLHHGLLVSQGWHLAEKNEATEPIWELCRKVKALFLPPKQELEKALPSPSFSYLPPRYQNSHPWPQPGGSFEQINPLFFYPTLCQNFPIYKNLFHSLYLQK